MFRPLAPRAVPPCSSAAQHFSPFHRCAAPPTPPPPPPPLLRRLRSGTSQSVPFVAGVMALILQNATGTPPANLQRLLAASAAANKLGEVAGSGFSSLAQVRLAWQLGSVFWGRRGVLSRAFCAAPPGGSCTLHSTLPGGSSRQHNQSIFLTSCLPRLGPLPACFPCP